MADITGSNDGQVGTSKSFSSEGENVFVGGLVDSRGGSVRRGGKSRELKIKKEIKNDEKHTIKPDI